MTKVLWIDASAGVAGDMMLGALTDAGVPLETMQYAVDAVVPGAVRLVRSEVQRAGLRATKVDVEVLVEDPPHRTWSTIREMLAVAELPEPVRELALAVFDRLAAAEGRVHGVSPEQVHFHEVGALDAIADVVGTCAAIAALGVDDVVVSPVALGSGTIEAHHGTLPVPPPAVLELSRGWQVVAGGQGELATPTGLALVTTLATSSGAMPAMTVESSGIGAGTKDRHGRANVVRTVLGEQLDPSGRAAGELETQDAVVVEANVDDLDPRLWPGVLSALLEAGAADAWLSSIVMKKGRPGVTLHVLAAPHLLGRVSDVVLEHSSTLGLRVSSVAKHMLVRSWAQVEVTREAPGDHATAPVRVKLGLRDGVVVRVQPEFEDVAALAAAWHEPEATVLARANAAAAAAGLTVGAPAPQRAD